MIYPVDALLPIFENNFCGFCELTYLEKKEIVEKYAQQAEKHIDRMSFYRLKDATVEFSEDVKLAICAIAELMYKKDNNGNIVREDTDGYSVTYKEPMNAYLHREIKEACMDYLGHTGIFQRSIGVIG